MIQECEEIVREFNATIILALKQYNYVSVSQNNHLTSDELVFILLQ